MSRSQKGRKSRHEKKREQATNEKIFHWVHMCTIRSNKGPSRHPSKRLINRPPIFMFEFQYFSLVFMVSKCFVSLFLPNFQSICILIFLDVDNQFDGLETTGPELKRNEPMASAVAASTEHQINGRRERTAASARCASRPSGASASPSTPYKVICANQSDMMWTRLSMHVSTLLNS